MEWLGTYAFQPYKPRQTTLRLGEGLVGQCAASKQTIFLEDVPADYVMIGSGLGEAKPLSLAILPVVHLDEVLGVIELASFQAFTVRERNFLDELLPMVGLNLMSRRLHSRGP